ncbi:hypothetical protein [Streptomyces sp. NPDC002104]
MFGTSAYEDTFEQAGVLPHGIATNHPPVPRRREQSTRTVDGNKRAAWLAAATFLALNGADLGDLGDLGDGGQGVAYGLVIGVAAGDEEHVGRIVERLRAPTRRV